MSSLQRAEGARRSGDVVLKVTPTPSVLCCLYKHAYIRRT